MLNVFFRHVREWQCGSVEGVDLALREAVRRAIVHVLQPAHVAMIEVAAVGKRNGFNGISMPLLRPAWAVSVPGKPLKRLSNIRFSCMMITR